MTRAVTEADVDADQLARILEPRSGVVSERVLAGGQYEASGGPMRTYRRTVTFDDLGADRAHVRQEVSFLLAIPYFRPMYALLFRRELRQLDPPRDRFPWWHPPEQMNERAAGALAVLAIIAIAFGYLNTLFSQTVAFAAEEFHADDSAQGFAGGVVRVGGALALVLIAASDRKGRRRMILVCTIAGCIVAATGAAAPSLAWLTASQLIARAFAAALLVIVGIAAAEEMPAGGRAYAVSLLALAAGLGAGICVMALRIADLGVAAWRILYLVPLLALPFARGVAARLHETRRFAARHRNVSLKGHGGRLALLGISGFLVNLHIAPSSQFTNRFLRVERHFSGGRIALLSLVTGTPGALGVLIGGRLADARGRRLVGAVTLLAGTGLDVLFYFTAGWPMWGMAFLSSVVLDASIPALGVYGPELFPTSLRGRANGIITVTSLAGSAVGLVLAGRLADSFGRIGPALAIMAIGPALLAALVIFAYPETAMRELEDLNPEDA
ncbi:MAG: hypothetical protein QOG64_1223 [Acidimicrobiaceae bacterium]|nr:hypothetical protein [Acidimicrobiaceae bacterium]